LLESARRTPVGRSPIVDRIADCDLVSFDVFDTLIFRAVARPIDAFELVKLRLLESETALFSPLIVDCFPANRVRAESLARDRMMLSSGQGEVTLDEIYATFAQLTGAAPDVIAELRRTELEVERKLVYPNPAAKELFEAVRVEGKRIVLCSDMYLPSDAVRELLARCGYFGYEKLYVSGEERRSKHRGTMFAHAARTHGVPLDRMLHIGDDEHSDVAIPGGAGCSTLHFSRERFARPAPAAWMDAENATIIRSIIQGLQEKRSQVDASASSEPWWDLGYRVFGPLLVGFMLWLKRIVAQNPPDKLIFIARDAHFLRAHMRRFLSELEPPIDMEYAYVSRGSLLLPSLTDFPLQRLKHLVSGKSSRSVGEHLRRLGLEPNVLTGVIRSVGYDSADDVVANGDPRMELLLGKLQHEILTESARLRPLAKSYLEGLVGDATQIVLVDVGWVGNTQSAFVHLLEPGRPQLQIRGCYVGTFDNARDNVYPGHPMHGWLTGGSDSPVAERKFWWAGGVELLEFAMTAPHPTTLGYASDENGVVTPTFEANSTDMAMCRLAQRLQLGAGEFVHDFRSVFGDIPAAGLDGKAWAGEYFRLVTAPTPEEAALLGDVTHSDAAGETSRRLPLAPLISDPDAAFETAHRSFWKAGFLVRNGLLDLSRDDRFCEEIYVALHPDVKAAVESGAFSSGHEHWIKFGRDEGRCASWSGWIREHCILGEEA
jgi:predicted HAD superfamily hydrolase